MAVQIQGACVTHHYIKAGQGNMSWKKLAGRTEMEEECTYFPKIFECIAYHVGVVQIPPVTGKEQQRERSSTSSMSRPSIHPPTDTSSFLYSRKDALHPTTIHAGRQAGSLSTMRI
jgi:hypothetical protein